MEGPVSDRFFASDNSAAVHPAVMDALNEANSGHAISYGDDRWTGRAVRVMKKRLGRRAEIFFVYNGTGANVVGIQAAVASYHAIICSDVSHINVDECGAVERFTGAKLLPVPTTDGRINPDQLAPLLEAVGVEHHSQPRVVSLTQSTEVGTVYDEGTVREIAGICHRHDMYLHVDGARISNAAVALAMDLEDITRRAGVDILSLGGTKNGLMFGEAVVFFRPELAKNFKYIRKQGMQLASKMRYIAVQFEALFGSDLWRSNAEHANALARHLAAGVQNIPGVELAYPVEANAVFARLPPAAIRKVQEEMYFYVWDADAGVVRFMVSYDTTADDVESLIAAVRRHCA